jgi:hypothetical protein
MNDAGLIIGAVIFALVAIGYIVKATEEMRK